jgi:hypothetical protein
MGRVLALCYPGGNHGPRMESKLLEDLADVVFGGALRDREFLGDPAVGQSSADEERHRGVGGS